MNFLKLVLKHILEISIVLVTFEIIFFQIFFLLVPTNLFFKWTEVLCLSLNSEVKNSFRQWTHTPTYFAELQYAKINNNDSEKFKLKS